MRWDHGDFDRTCLGGIVQSERIYRMTVYFPTLRSNNLLSVTVIRFFWLRLQARKESVGILPTPVHTSSAVQAIVDSGIRAFSGKVMMYDPNPDTVASYGKVLRSLCMNGLNTSLTRLWHPSSLRRNNGSCANTKPTNHTQTG